MNQLQCLRIFLLPFSILYWIIIVLKEFIYKSQLLSKIFSLNIIRSQVPIVCVGNIRVGGTGKSQIVLEIARQLIEQNQKVAVLSRGYKRKSKGFFEVDTVDADKFGDEPVLIKMNLSKARVFVSENRKLAVAKLNQMNEFDFILMDDGLQNLSVHKDFSIVVSDKNYYSKNLIENILLPAGNLRELKSKIFKYDCLIYNKKFDDEGFKEFNHKIFLEAIYLLNSLIDMSGHKFEIDELRKLRLGAFCGIAQPLSFKKLLEKNSIFTQFFKVFPDHYNYKIQDLELLLKFVEKFKANHLITTEKDIVRLIKYKDKFERAGVFLIYAKITAKIKNEERLIQDILCLKRK